MEYGKIPKRLVVRGLDHMHAKLHLKLKLDRIKQHAFFVEFINGYINDDPIIREWINNNPNIKVNKHKKRVEKRENKNIEKQEKQLNLNKEVVDEIFDILAEEFGDS